MKYSRLAVFTLTALLPLACTTTPVEQPARPGSFPLTSYPGEDGIWGPKRDLPGKSALAPGRHVARGPFPVDMASVAARKPGDKAPPGMERVADKRIESPVSEEERERMIEEALRLPPNAKAARGLLSGPDGSGGALGPSVGNGWPSIDYINSVPPDPEMAAGPNHVIATVNSAFEIYLKDGTVVKAQTDFDAFFSGVCTNTFDPNALYDEDQDRFIIAMDGNGDEYCVAVSVTGDPTGAWYRYAVPTGADFFDYPHAGVGDDAIYMGANMFTQAGSYLRSEVYAIDKFAMYAGASAPYVMRNLGGAYFTPQPMNAHGAAQGTWPAGGPHYFIVGTYSGNNFYVFSWADPFGANQWSNRGSVSLNAATGVTAANTVDQPQLGSTTLLQGNDWRGMDAEYRNGHLWMSHMLACNPGGGTVNCVRWAQIDPVTVSVVDAGVLASSGEYRSFPNLAADACDNMAVGYTKTSTSMYPGIWVAGREAADPAGTLQAENQAKAGELTYSAFDGSPYRWGDYTGMTVDPDGSTFWYLGEYSKNTGSSNRWGTWINSFTFGCVPGNAPPDIRLVQGSVSHVSTGGDGDEFADNCETTTVDFELRNTGADALTNVEIVSIASTSHPNTVVFGAFPQMLPDLAKGETTPASFDFSAIDAAYGDTLEFEVEVYADQLASNKIITLSVANAETDLTAVASRTWNFASGLEDWTRIQGTFNHSSGAGAGGASGYLASSANLNGQCDQVRSPVVYLGSNSTLSLSTNYDIEPIYQGRYWYDQANVAVQSGGQRAIVDPDGGRPYNADGFGASCVTSGGNGWSDVATSWASSSWSSGALAAPSYAGKPVQIDVAYGTDSVIVGRGFWFDQVTLTNFSQRGADGQSNACGNPPANITDFSPSQNPIGEGDSFTLTWAADHATSCSGSGQGWSGPAGATSGSDEVAPGSAGTYTYTLNCTGDGGPDSASFDLTVNPPPAVSIDSFTASASPITLGDAVTLSWTTSNATSCAGSGDWSGDKATGTGQETLTPDTARVHSFTLSCEGPGGPVSDTVAVTVNPPPAPVIDDFSATPNPVEEGIATTLSWSASNATSCSGSGDGWGGTGGATSGSSSVVPGAAGDHGYSLSCTGAGGTTNASLTVTVTPPPGTLHVGDIDGFSTPGSRGRWDATVTFTVHDGDHNPVDGATVTASWVSGATGGISCTTGASGQCSATKANLKSNVASVSAAVSGLSGGTANYVAGDNHDADGDSDGTSITVYQNGPPAVSIDAFTASPDPVAENEATTLSWSVSNATSCTAGGAWSGFKNPAGGSESVTPGAAGSYSYTLSCTDGSTSDNASVTVTVSNGGGGGALHVAALTGSSASAPRSRWDATATVFVVNSNGTAVAGVTVDGAWSGGANGSSTCVTDNAGSCSVGKANLKSNVSSVTFTVGNLTATGYSYDAGANVTSSVTITYP